MGCTGISKSSGLGVSFETFLNRTLAGNDHAILIFHSSAVAVKHKQDLIVFLIPTTEAQMVYVILTESVGFFFNVYFFTRFMPFFFFLEFLVNPYQPLSYIKFNTSIL